MDEFEEREFEERMKNDDELKLLVGVAKVEFEKLVFAELGKLFG